MIKAPGVVAFDETKLFDVIPATYGLVKGWNLPATAPLRSRELASAQ
jgi:hypothetical protein